MVGFWSRKKVQLSTYSILSGFLMLSFLALSSGMAGQDDEPAGTWEKLSDGDGIEVFRKEIPDSPIISFKGQGIVDAPIAKLAAVLLTAARATEWVDRLVSIQLLRKISATEFVEYTHVATPVVMKDRDCVAHYLVSADPKAKSFHVSINSVEDPLAPKTDYVRTDIKNSSFTLQSIENGTKTFVTTVIFADPKGSVPKWIVNLFQKSWPRNTLESLRRQAAKADVYEDPYYKKLFSGT